MSKLHSKNGVTEPSTHDRTSPFIALRESYLSHILSVSAYYGGFRRYSPASRGPRKFRSVLLASSGRLAPACFAHCALSLHLLSPRLAMDERSEFFPWLLCAGVCYLRPLSRPRPAENYTDFPVVVGSASRFFCARHARFRSARRRVIYLARVFPGTDRWPYRSVPRLGTFSSCALSVGVFVLDDPTPGAHSSALYIPAPDLRLAARCPVACRPSAFPFFAKAM